MPDFFRAQSVLRLRSMHTNPHGNRASRFATIKQTLLYVVLLALASVAGAHAAKPATQDARKLSPYRAIIVEAFTVQKSAATKDIPIGLESALQNDAVTKLRAAALFDAVINAAPAPAEAASVAQPLDLRVNAAQPIAPTSAAGQLSPSQPVTPDRRLTLHGTIISFNKGNRAARYFGGFGAGESKLKVRFTLLDAKTGAELMTWEQTGTFKGMFSPFGGSSGKADDNAANSVIKGLLKKIEENR
jgi:Domain of unknown function (DUF4410)